MQVDDGTVRKALEEHFKHYASGKSQDIDDHGKDEGGSAAKQRSKEWSIDEHVKMWEKARKAFDQSSFLDFTELYKTLRNSWKVFRGNGSYWPEQKTFDTLVKCDVRLDHSRLSGISTDDWSAIWERIQSVQGIKVNKTGPSVVAVSKFLHFWNPRLFLIVDDGVVWKWVFAHNWLREQVGQTRRETDRICHADEHDDEVCDLPTYFAILVWASQLVQKNPCIVRQFHAHIRKYAHIPVPDEVAEYEAAAVEWFLLGLVELPPAGVSGV